MDRNLDCDPVLHDLVHGVQLVKLDRTQSTGQLCVLQDRVSSRYGQAYPPDVAFAITVLERDWVPPVVDKRRRVFLLPVGAAAGVVHDWVHAVQALKLDTTQWPGHACVLHVLFSARYGQAYPPNRGSVTTVRDLDCTPEPHDLEQSVHCVKLVTTQCWGHGPGLQVWVSAVCGHATPPNCGCATLRVRDWNPSPHVLVQAPNASNAPTTQSTAHGCALQLRVSARYGHA